MTTKPENEMDKMREAFDKNYAALVRRQDRQTKRNNEGMQLEKDGETSKAIALYEINIAEGFDGSYPYDRLAVLYRKAGQCRDEIRVLERAVEVFQKLVGQGGRRGRRRSWSDIGNDCLALSPATMRVFPKSRNCGRCSPRRSSPLENTRIDSGACVRKECNWRGNGWTPYTGMSLTSRRWISRATRGQSCSLRKRDGLTRPLCCVTKPCIGLRIRSGMPRRRTACCRRLRNRKARTHSAHV